jgi:hypothetical protein
MIDRFILTKWIAFIIFLKDYLLQIGKLFENSQLLDI